MNKNENRILKLHWLFFLILSLPVILIAFYNHPSADDYVYGSIVQNWVQENGYHIIGILKCAAEFSYQFYFNWSGSYADSFTGALMPESFGIYWAAAIIIYFLLSAGIIYLFRTLAEGMAGKEYKWIGSIGGILAVVAVVQNWPSSVEALYWYDGAQSYMGYHALYLLMCGITVKYMFGSNEKKSKVLVLLSSIMAFVIAGGNNVTSFMSVLTFVFLFAISLLIRKRYFVAVPMVSSVVGFLINFLAPGTTVRGGGEYFPIVTTIIKCFRWTLRQYLLEWLNTGTVLLLLFLTPLLIKLIRKTGEKWNFKFRCPVGVMIGAVCFLSAMSSPAFYVLGESGPLRLHNVIYVNFVILIVFSWTYFLGWVCRNKLEDMQSQYLSEIYEHMQFKYILVAMILVYVWICSGTAGKYGTSLEATKELLNGSAASYSKQINERYQLYTDPSEKEIIVEPLTVKPELLFFDDITDDQDNWKNHGVAEYFGKESVRLSIYDPDIDYD